MTPATSVYGGSPAVAVLQSTLPKCLIGVISDASRQLREQDPGKVLDMDRFRDVESWGGWDFGEDGELPPRMEHLAQCMDLGVGATLTPAAIDPDEGDETNRDRVTELVSAALHDVCAVAARHSEDDFIPDPMYPDDATLMTEFGKQLLTSACTKLSGAHMKCVAAFDTDYEVRDPAWPCVQAVLAESVVHAFAAMAGRCREQVGDEEEEDDEEGGDEMYEYDDGVEEEDGRSADPMLTTVYEDDAERDGGGGGGGPSLDDTTTGGGSSASSAVGVVPLDESEGTDDDEEEEVVPKGAPRSSFRRSDE